MRIKTISYISIVLSILIILSGCAGIDNNKTTSASPGTIETDGTNAGSSEKTEVQTTPTNTQQPQNGNNSVKELPKYPKYVDKNLSVDEAKLLRTHINKLVERNRSIRSNHRQISHWQNNGSSFVNGTVQAKGNQTEYFNRVNASSFHSVGYYWENKTVGYVRNVPFREWFYEKAWNGKYDDPHQTFASASYTGRLRWVIIDLEVKPVQRGYTENGEPRIIFENVNQSGSGDFTNKMLMDEISNFSLRFATSPDGRVTNATWRLNGTYNGEPVNRTEKWNYEYGVNVSTRPEWVETARQNAQAIEVTHPTNITYKIEHLGDKSVPAGARISVLTPTATADVILKEPFEPTDVVYIAAPNQTLQTYRTQPSGEEFLPLPSRVSISILFGPVSAMGDSHPESFRWREFLVEEAD